MKEYRKRVYLLITRLAEAGQQLLVFQHASKQLWCGIQTPGGSIEEGEEPLVAALREGFEETGLHLSGLELIACDIFEAQTEILERYFFHCKAPLGTPDKWTHKVHGTGIDSGVDFVLFWLDLPDLGGLSPHFHAYTDRIPSLNS